MGVLWGKAIACPRQDQVPHTRSCDCGRAGQDHKKAASASPSPGIFHPCERHNTGTSVSANLRAVQERTRSGRLFVPCVCIPGDIWLRLTIWINSTLVTKIQKQKKSRTAASHKAPNLLLVRQTMPVFKGPFFSL